MVKMCKPKSEKTSDGMKNEEHLSASSMELKTSSESSLIEPKNCETNGCCQSERKIFTAPPGVKRYNVKWTNIRRNSGGQKLIFVWPQKPSNRTNYLIYFVPLLRRMVIGLMYLGSIHLWPGEFLPSIIPPTVPLPKPPVRCNVIEPLWDEEDKTSTKKP